MKKKLGLVFIALLSMFFTTPVLAKNIASCDSAISSTVLIDEMIPNTVSTIITIIKIAVPILLVIFGMIDLFKGLTAQKEDEMKKGQQIFIKRLIAGAIVFFVFSIVQFLISFVAGEDKNNIFTCTDCFLNNKCTYRPNDNGTCDKGFTLKNKQCVENK